MKVIILVLCVLIAVAGVYLYTREPQAPQSPKKVIVLLGPPGSGKGTQAVRLSKELQIPHISTGDLFRENLSKKTELGQKAKQYMDKGQLVPDEVVLNMLFDRVSQPDCTRGYLLDGFPRTIPQAEALDKYLDKENAVIAINLDVADETIIKRMSGRLTCRACGHIHNKHFAPPAKEGVCDRCQGELYQRADDAEAVVEERLRVYHNQTKPLISYYQKKGILTTLNGELAPDQVFSELLERVK